MSDVFYAGMIPFYIASCGYSWGDFFGRAGPGVGADWMQNTHLRTLIVSTPTSLPFTIDDGAAIVACATVASPAIGMGTMVQVAPTPISGSVGQFITVTVEDFFQLPGSAANFRTELQIINYIDPATGAGHFGYLRWESDVQKLTLVAWSRAIDGSFGDSPEVDLDPYGGPTGDLVLNLESYNSGRQILSLNGIIIIDSIDTGAAAILGSYQGATLWWNVQFGSCGDAGSPRIAAIFGGAICPGDETP